MTIISLFYLSTFNNIERDNNTILGGNSPHFSNKQRILAVAVIEDNQLRSCHKPSKETQKNATINEPVPVKRETNSNKSK
jgi:hypothetical protein